MEEEENRSVGNISLNNKPKVIIQVNFHLISSPQMGATQARHSDKNKIDFRSLIFFKNAC